MKRRILIFLSAFIIMFSLTACGSKNSGTLKCSKTSKNDDGLKVEETMVVTYENDEVTKVEETSIEQMDKSSVDMAVSFGQLFATALNEVDGFKVSYSKEGDSSVKYVMSVDYKKLDLVKLKEAFGESFDEKSLYSSKDLKLDVFKKENLEGFTCK